MGTKYKFEGRPGNPEYDGFEFRDQRFTIRRGALHFHVSLYMSDLWKLKKLMDIYLF